MSDNIDADAVRDETARDRAITAFQRIKRGIATAPSDKPKAEREQYGPLVDEVLGSLRLADDEGAVGAASDVLAPLLYGRDAERSMASDAAARKVLARLDRYLTGESTEPEAR